MAKKTLRVKIPTNPTDLLTLADFIYQKHTDDGEGSPLNQLEDDNWTDNGVKIADAQTLDAQAKQLEKSLESVYAQRNILIEPVKRAVLASRDLLLGKYSKNPKKLGDWNFEVDDTPKATKKVTVTA